MFAAFTLLLLLYISLLIIRFASIILVNSGMSEESAYLQAHSAFSGCGFTTSESERMVQHPARRKILIFLMVLGNIGIVSILTTTVLGIVKHFESQERLWVKIVILVPGLCLLWFLTKNRFFQKILTRFFNWIIALRQKNREISALTYIAHFPENFKVAELYIDTNSKLIGNSIPDNHMICDDINVLGISESEEKYYGCKFPPKLKIKNGAVLVLYGPAEKIEQFCKNTAEPDAKQTTKKQ